MTPCSITEQGVFLQTGIYSKISVIYNLLTTIAESNTMHTCIVVTPTFTELGLNQILLPAFHMLIFDRKFLPKTTVVKTLEFTTILTTFKCRDMLNYTELCQVSSIFTHSGNLV